MASLARSITSSLRKRRRETILPKSRETLDIPDDPADTMDEATDDDEKHSPKRRREADWPLRNDNPSYGDLISKNTKELASYIKEHNLPEPSFSVDGPAQVLPATADDRGQNARLALISATQELNDLVTGPTEKLRWMTRNVWIPLS